MTTQTETTYDYPAILYALHRHKAEVSQSEKDWLKTPFKLDANKASSVLRKHMEDEELDELRDSEHGISGTRERRTNVSYDIRTAPPDMVVWLAQNGYLDVKKSKVEEDMKSSPSMWLNLLHEKDSAGNYKYRVEGETYALKTTEEPR